MSENDTKRELTLLSGDGTVIFREEDDGLYIELFQQNMLADTVSFENRNEIVRWLIDGAFGARK